MDLKVKKLIGSLPSYDTPIIEILDAVTVVSLEEALSACLDTLKVYHDLEYVTKTQLSDITDNYKTAHAACTMIEYFSGEDLSDIRYLLSKYHDKHAMPF